jgi:integrase
MPLKLLPPQGTKHPNYRIRGTYLGRHVEQSARTSKRALASKLLKGIESAIERGEMSEPGEATFASAALAYMNAGGERTYLPKLLEHFGDAPISQIKQNAIDKAAVDLYPGGTPATRNRSVYTPVNAVLRHAGVSICLQRPRGAGGNKQTAWLWPEQAEAIFAEAGKLDPEFRSLLVLLCYTGLRLGEALGLTWENTRLQDGYAYVPDTKNNEPRAVFLPPVAVAALANVDRRNKGRVFRWAKSGHLYSLLRQAAGAAGVSLPERSAFHICRRTYATWMMRYAGLNTRQLVGTGAWKDARMADRYAQTIMSEEARKAVFLPAPAYAENRG